MLARCDRMLARTCGGSEREGTRAQDFCNEQAQLKQIAAAHRRTPRQFSPPTTVATSYVPGSASSLRDPGTYGSGALSARSASAPTASDDTPGPFTEIPLASHAELLARTLTRQGRPSPRLSSLGRGPPVPPRAIHRLYTGRLEEEWSEEQKQEDKAAVKRRLAAMDDAVSRLAGSSPRGSLGASGSVRPGWWAGAKTEVVRIDIPRGPNGRLGIMFMKQHVPTYLLPAGLHTSEDLLSSEYPFGPFVVKGIEPLSPAALSGMLQVGDEIYEVDGQAVYSLTTAKMSEALQGSLVPRAGSVVQLLVFRQPPAANKEVRNLGMGGGVESAPTAGERYTLIEGSSVMPGENGGKPLTQAELFNREGLLALQEEYYLHAVKSGSARKGLGQYEAALDSYNRALALDPHQTELRTVVDQLQRLTAANQIPVEQSQHSEVDDAVADCCAPKACATIWLLTNPFVCAGLICVVPGFGWWHWNIVWTE